MNDQMSCLVQGYEDQAQKEPIARDYHRLLSNLDVALVVSKKERGRREAKLFESRPHDFNLLTADGNEGRLQDWVYGDRVEMLTGPVLAAIDVDTKNGGDIEGYSVARLALLTQRKGGGNMSIARAHPGRGLPGAYRAAIRRGGKFIGDDRAVMPSSDRFVLN